MTVGCNNESDMSLKSKIERELAGVPFANFDYSVNISLKNHFLYVETPKVCCSTIKLNLQRLETGFFDFRWPDFESVHKRELSPLIKPSQVLDLDRLLAQTDIFKFCFVRNPYSRFLSCYLDKIKSNSLPRREALIAMNESPDARRDISFDDFLDVVGNQNIGEMNPHWRPQYYQTFQSVFKFDFIGRYEYFSRDFNYVLNQIAPHMIRDGFSSELRHKTGSTALLELYYTPHRLKRVRQLYDIDFRYFSYT